MPEYPDWFIRRIQAIRNKRPRIVAEHILAHGSITTEELTTLYGYNHPPRAARDLRETGIPLETFRVKNAEGRTIAAYRFGNIEAVRADRLAGRATFPKRFKQQLIERDGAKCSICQSRFEGRYLQIDHRIPYEVVGDSEVPEERNFEDYMLICGTCNRAKSWSCEHCPNWIQDKDPQICVNCYWATPESYIHIALRHIRRVEVVWEETEITLYENLKTQAEMLDLSMPEYVKKLVNKLGGKD